MATPLESEYSDVITEQIQDVPNPLGTRPAVEEGYGLSNIMLRDKYLVNDNDNGYDNCTMIVFVTTNGAKLIKYFNVCEPVMKLSVSAVKHYVGPYYELRYCVLCTTYYS